MRKNLKFTFLKLRKLGLLVCLLPSTVFAGSNVMFFNGSQLYNMCRDTNIVNQAACEGYILGIQDTIYSGYLAQYFDLCFPNGVTPAQLRLQTIKFMESNPNTMNFTAEGIVAKTLEGLYACKKEKNVPQKE